ncbi:MAG: Asp23/Gls24 family envelope stress response protein [Oscillospiraceae bacterium]|nr:Asp23/Gls24 family envelope stress response protein [Oscillospiraceae bacterium]
MNIPNNRGAVGSLKISDEVVSSIAAMAATEIVGVAELAPMPVNLKGVIRKSSAPKSINISLNDDVATIDIYVKLQYGAKIPEVSEKIQRSVKTSVQNMTGIAVAKVNVFIAGITFEDSSNI